MTQPVYGITFRRDNHDPRPAIPSDLSVIGLVLPSDDADATAFPLDEPVAFDSADTTILPKLGTGDLYNAVKAIDDQMAEFQTSARIVAVRVADAPTDGETIANIIGDRSGIGSSGGTGTGMYALLRSGPQLGVIPRLIGMPLYTHHTIDASTLGKGVALEGTPIKTTSGKTLYANPIIAQLPPILNALMAHAIVSGPGTDLTDAIDWRETFSSSRLIAIDAWRKVYNGVDANGNIKTRDDDGVAAMLGVAARVDFIHAGFPFWSWSGQQVYGTMGLKHYWPFSLTDGATTGQEFLANHIGIIERGEMGVETAIADSGFVFAGLWNTDNDPLWWFYNKTRGRDWAHLALLKSIRLRLGVENVTPHGVQAVLNDMTVVGQELINNDCSVGFKVSFEKDRNSPDNLRQGKFVVAFATEEPAPIAHITIDSRPNYQALIEELGTLIAQAATLPSVYLR